MDDRIPDLYARSVGAVPAMAAPGGQPAAGVRVPREPPAFLPQKYAYTDWQLPGAGNHN